MELEKSIKSKLTHQFWKVKLKEELIGRLPDSFFIKEVVENPQTDHEICLDLPQTVYDKVLELCDNNPVLSYVYFLTALHISFNKYGTIQPIPVCHGGFKQLNFNSGVVFYPIQCDTSETFKELFLRVRKEVAEASLYPVDCIEDSSQFSHLQSVVFHIENMGRPPQEFTPYEWMLAIIPENHQLKLITDSSSAYNQNVLKNFLQSFIHVLKQVIENPDVKIGEINSLDPDQRYLLLEEFNTTSQGRSTEYSITKMVEFNALQRTDHIAVQFKNACWSYSQLNNRVNQIAAFMQSVTKLNKEDRVLIFMDRSDLFLMSVLAIWKNGACYIPVDPIYPDERIIDILESASPVLIISQTELLNRAQLKTVFSSYQVIDLDRSKDAIDTQTTENPGIDIDHNQLAYIIYTSGSTGKPKGVMIEHKGMLNHIFGKIDVLNIDESSVVVQNASQGFDISIWQMFAALAEGGKTVMYDDDLVYNIKNFIHRIEEDQVTILELVPSYFLELLNILELEEYAAVWSKMDHVVLNAETLKNDMVRRWFKIFPGKKISNTYGATEVSDDTSHFVMTSQPDSMTVPVMQRPFPNFNIYVLDENMLPCPIGVIGDIYIAGFSVGRGYFKDEEKTKASFFKNPLHNSPYEKLYKTGDLGRYLSCGSLEFMGRKDHQVKVRGHRVELGDIENQLLNIPGVNNAIVVDLPDESGLIFLAAYVDKKATFSGELSSEEIKDYLQTVLPAYMIPRFVVVMPHLPLNTNGKIDRKQLPAPSYESVGFGLYKAPVSKTEILLVEIWQEVLALSKVGITDNFFELGGHSLMVDQVINRINRQLGKTISFRIFFTNPTIEGLIKKMFENEYTPIPQSPEATSYPLTTSQSRLWILSQLDGGSLAYNMSSVIKLKGNIEIDIFEESFKLLIGRHEILRTYFESNEDGEIHQYILPKENLSFKVEVEDFSLSENQEEAAIQHVQNISNRPFDLEQAPLFRVLLCKVQKDEFLLLFSMHHIIGDGWSSRIAISEFVNIYNSLTDGTPVSLPVLDIQYKDYTLWMQEETKGEKFRKAEAYWLEQFEGELPVLELPSFNSRPLIQTYNGNSITHQFQEGFLEKLETFSKAHDATLFMLLMTGINALLYKYSNQKDMVIGIPIAGREHPDLENQLGLYLNTLAIRTRLREKNSFSDLLAIQKEALLGAYDHQIYPFDKLVEKLDLKRDTSRSALFDVMVVLQNQRQINSFGNEELSNIKASDYQLTSKTSQFDISFIFVETDKLNLTIEYNTDIYDEFLIQRMFTHFENLITDVIEDSTGQVIIEDIDCLTNAERNQLLIEFNDKKMDYPSDKTIAQLFEEQVDKTPENAAVFFENTELTYRELNEQANQLGDYLRQKYQLKPDDLVAIKLERSEKMIVSIFGILKSGAAYVPIDPNYPQERVEYIEKDTKTKVTIDEAFLENYRKDLEKSEKDYTKENLPIISTPDSLAYVIYTSGTTGEPKGVMIENKNLTNLIWGQVIEFDFKDNESVLLFANYTFDASVEQIFLALLRGAVLHVVSKNIITDPKSLQEYIKEHQVTHFHTVPIILDKMTLDNDTHLNRIISGGDTCSQKLVNRFDNHSFSFYNGYGPTEVTVTSIQLLYAGGKISIGKPLSNTQVYILDDNKEVVPVGVGGKLYISGDGLSRRGYLNKPELTSERFVGNPFDAEMKMYDTGDLARWLPNGNIEFLGRHDFQIKIRGFRIELGEIETNVRQFSSSIRQVFAEAKEFNGEKVLVVYYAYAGNASIGKTELREFLQSKLPEYMVPSFYVELEMLPLNANGKVDRKLLPDISENDVIKNKYVAPENEIENQLVLIWQEVLGINKIGITDHFFELGGNSLNALTVWSKIKKLKNLNIKLSDIYSSPTIQKLSIIKPNKSLLVDLNTSFEKKNTSMYCIPPITGIPGVFKNLSARVESNINCYGFEYSGINNGDAFFKSIEEASQMFCKEIIERHQGHSHIIIFGYSMGGSIAFEMMKTLENKYDNISFVLAESYISKNHYQEDIIEENTNNNLEIIEAYAKENNIDFDQNLKNYIINNNTIFNQYFQKGKIKSDIYLFQSNESSDNMLEWEKFTNGSIEIEKIKGNHWEAMSEFNNEIYEKRINELFK